MRSVSLDGAWQLWHFPEGDGEPSGPDGLPTKGEPIAATVPGNVELDLARAGQLRDPFFGRNCFDLRELEFHSWWYRRTFDLDSPEPQPTSRLVFDGLDTIATVWLNGVRLGESANGLVPQTFPTKGALRAGTNELVVRLGSAVAWAAGQPYEPLHESWERREEALWLRKPAHSFGWDITPRIVSAGIWRGVRLEFPDTDELSELYFYTVEAAERLAVLGVWFRMHTVLPLAGDLALRISGVCGDSRFETTVPCEFVSGRTLIEIDRPRLWWPKGCGTPDLYTVTTELVRRGEVRARRTDRVGLRTVALDYREGVGEKGRFRFVINGEPLRLVGANWVPLDAFHSRDLERTEPVIDLFDDVGCQMIRCWGGGVYESDRFYDLCDERGLLIWQDFALACGRYPQAEAFQAVLRAEAEAVVARLRNHPSIALWSGDNECDYAFNTVNTTPDDNILTRRVLPEVVRRLDPYRPYLPSSPYFSPGVREGRRQPEQHLWGPRDYFKSPFYTVHDADFISEIGYHGCPNRSSLERFLPAEDLWPWDNPSWRAHAVEHWARQRRGYDRNELMVNQVREMFGAVPEDLDAFIRASQFTQAEAKKFFVEQVRLKRLGGVLWWNVIDCWPQISDAVVDYYYSKKLAYHYLWRVQRPVCLMIAEPEAWGVRVVADNLSRTDRVARFSVREAGKDTLLEGEATVPSGASVDLGRLPVFRGEQRLFLIEWTIGDKRFGNHYLLGAPPFSRKQYESWLPEIAALPRAFDPASVGVR